MAEVAFAAANDPRLDRSFVSLVVSMFQLLSKSGVSTFSISETSCVLSFIGGGLAIGMGGDEVVGSGDSGGGVSGAGGGIRLGGGSTASGGGGVKRLEKASCAVCTLADAVAGVAVPISGRNGGGAEGLSTSLTTCAL